MFSARIRYRRKALQRRLTARSAHRPKHSHAIKLFKSVSFFVLTYVEYHEYCSLQYASLRHHAANHSIAFRLSCSRRCSGAGPAEKSCMNDVMDAIINIRSRAGSSPAIVDLLVLRFANYVMIAHIASQCGGLCIISFQAALYFGAEQRDNVT